MPTVEISVDLSSDDYDRLESTLPKGFDVEKVAELVARAGALELLSQAAGHHVFNAITDLRHYRIYCLLVSGIDVDTADAIVAALFKVPLSTAKRWVRTSMARYDVDLKTAFDAATVKVLKSAKWDANKTRWVVAIQSAAVEARLFDLIDSLNLLMPTRDRKGSVWTFPDETLVAVFKAVGLKEPTHK